MLSKGDKRIDIRDFREESFTRYSREAKLPMATYSRLPHWASNLTLTLSLPPAKALFFRFSLCPRACLVVSLVVYENSQGSREALRLSHERRRQGVVLRARFSSSSSFETFEHASRGKILLGKDL